jgi:hypothetical protein
MNERIQQLYLQEVCSHPDATGTLTGAAEHGNYDPSCDKYWIEYHCLHCNKYWTKDQ